MRVLGSATGLATVASWTAESNQTSAHLGSALAAGDVDGDGFDDLVVGAGDYDDPDSGEGAVWLYRGTAAGLAAAPSWSVESNQPGAGLGMAVAVGDTDGDGFAEVIAGAPYYDDGSIDEGWAALYAGSAAGPSAAADWTGESDQADALFGQEVAHAGDLDGDGFGEVVIGAPTFDVALYDEGEAFLSTGPPGVKLVSARSTGPGQVPLRPSPASAPPGRRGR